MCALYPGGPVKKTETVSYRIPSDVKSALKEEARRLGINPNALVSQIFNRHISWGRYVGQLKCIPVSKDFLRLVFGSMPRTEVEKVGRLLGESAAHEELLFLFSRITPGTILLFIPRGRSYCSWTFGRVILTPGTIAMKGARIFSRSSTMST